MAAQQNRYAEKQYHFFHELAAAQNLDLTRSVYATLVDEGKGDASHMTDILMNWMMDDPAMKEVMAEERKRRLAAEEEARKKAEAEAAERKKKEDELVRQQALAYERILQADAKKKAEEEAR